MSETTAIHAQDGDDHLVGVGHLRVLVTHDEEGWFAQGIEIDYAAFGGSLEDVQQRFQTGLRGTVEAHLERHGTIEGLLKFAPRDAYEALLGARPSAFEFTMVSFHNIPEWRRDLESLPYSGITFLQNRRVAA